MPKIFAFDMALGYMLYNYLIRTYFDTKAMLDKAIAYNLKWTSCALLM